MHGQSAPVQGGGQFTPTVHAAAVSWRTARKIESSFDGLAVVIRTWVSPCFRKPAMPYSSSSVVLQLSPARQKGSDGLAVLSPTPPTVMSAPLIRAPSSAFPAHDVSLAPLTSTVLNWANAGF